MGVEVYHPTHSASEVRILEKLCREYGLLMTGGSDYHGPDVKGVEQTKLNMMHLSLNLLEPIKASAGC